MKAVFAVLLGLMISAAPAFAQETADESESGLSVPRMVSLRSNLINARSGPGARYPIEWVYMQKARRWKLSPSLNFGAKSKTGRVRNPGCTNPCFPAVVRLK